MKKATDMHDSLESTPKNQQRNYQKIVFIVTSICVRYGTHNGRPVQKGDIVSITISAEVVSGVYYPRWLLRSKRRKRNKNDLFIYFYRNTRFFVSDTTRRWPRIRVFSQRQRTGKSFCFRPSSKSGKPVRTWRIPTMVLHFPSHPSIRSPERNVQFGRCIRSGVRPVTDNRIRRVYTKRRTHVCVFTRRALAPGGNYVYSRSVRPPPPSPGAPAVRTTKEAQAKKVCARGPSRAAVFFLVHPLRRPRVFPSVTALSRPA